jgi:hypothetical protein
MVRPAADVRFARGWATKIAVTHGSLAVKILRVDPQYREDMARLRYLYDELKAFRLDDVITSAAPPMLIAKIASMEREYEQIRSRYDH